MNPGFAFVNLLVSALLISGCAALSPDPTATPIPTDTPTPSPEPTDTATPAITPTPTPLPSGLVFSFSPNEVIRRRNVEVEPLRVVVGDREALASGHPMLVGEEVPSFSRMAYSDDTVLAKIEFRISNQTGRELIFFAQDMFLVLGGRQASLDDYLLDGEVFGDDFVGEVQDTVTIQTGLWVGSSNVDLVEVDTITFNMGQAWATTTGSFIEQYAGGFSFSLDATDRVYEPPPEGDS